MKLSPVMNQFLCMLGVALNLMSNGSTYGYPLILFDQLKRTKELTLDTNNYSTFASVLGICIVIGCLVAPVLMNRFGRRPAHICSTIPITLGWLMTAFAPNFTVLIIARLFHGLGIGLRAPVAGLLIGECSDPKFRGAFLSSFAIFLSLGILTSHLMGSLISWRMTALILALIPFASMMIMLICPESPSWLAAKGEFRKSREAFRQLRGNDTKSNQELEELIISQSGTVKRDGMNFWKAFKYREFYYPVVISLTLEVMYEVGGGHTMAAYANVILTSLLNKPNVSLEVTILDALRVFTAVSSVLFFKKWRRRLIFIIGSSTTIFSIFLIATYKYLWKFEIIPESRAFTMCLFIVYTLSFGLCLVPLAHVVGGELYPLRFRSFSSTISIATLMPIYMTSLKTTPYFFQEIGVEGTFMIFALILSVCFVVVAILLPETKDKTLQEIECSFKKKTDTECVNAVEMELLKTEEPL